MFAPLESAAETPQVDLSAQTEEATLADPEACVSRARIHLLKREIAQGNIDAMAFLGQTYLSDGCTQAEHSLGLSWLDRAAAHNHPAALFHLGTIIIRNAAGPEETTYGLAYVARSAEQGHREASAFWGTHLMARAETLAEREQAFFWLGQAASDGSVMAALAASHFYETGLHGVEPDACSADLWRETAMLVQHPEIGQPRSAPESCN